MIIELEYQLKKCYNMNFLENEDVVLIIFVYCDLLKY